MIKFRGQDHGKTKLEIETEVNHIDFPEGATLKSIFTSMNENEDKTTPFGEIVYIRSVLDFSIKNQ